MSDSGMQIETNLFRQFGNSDWFFFFGCKTFKILTILIIEINTSELWNISQLNCYAIPFLSFFFSLSHRLKVAANMFFKSGILKLQHDVRACQYEDVHVMWEMLQRNEMDQSPVKRRNRSFWSFFGWARSAPSLCRSFWLCYSMGRPLA